MQETNTLEAGGYYLFESLASSRSCYFESEEEIQIFKMLLFRYLGKILDIQKMYLSSEGYQLLIKIRRKELLRKVYKEKCKKKGRAEIRLFLDAPWRIVSEQIRIFHSVYVKQVNKMRGRKGVLVQERYRRYYFEGLEDLQSFIKRREDKKEIESQVHDKYRVDKKWIELVDWGKIWRKGFVCKVFQDYVVEKLVNFTFHLHSHPT